MSRSLACDSGGRSAMRASPASAISRFCAQSDGRRSPSADAAPSGGMLKYSRRSPGLVLRRMRPICSSRRAIPLTDPRLALQPLGDLRRRLFRGLADGEVGPHPAGHRRHAGAEDPCRLLDEAVLVGDGHGFTLRSLGISVNTETADIEKDVEVVVRQSGLKPHRTRSAPPTWMCSSARGRAGSVPRHRIPPRRPLRRAHERHPVAVGSRLTVMSRTRHH